MTSTTVGRAAAVMAGAAAVRAAVRHWRAPSFEGKSVAIFGGSRGLGLKIAERLTREGARLGLFARDADELAAAIDVIGSDGAAIFVKTCDVRDRVQVAAAVARQVETYGGIDVVVNDAGVIQVGPIAHMQLPDYEDAMATHYWGPLYAITSALPYLRLSESPRIVNIASIGGRVAVPHLIPYTASKFALVGLSDGLRAELADQGIKVTTVCPGLMRTGSTYNAQFKGRHRAEFAWFHFADSMPGLSVSADTAARRIVEACRHGDAELVIGLPARAAILLRTICPGTWSRLMATINRALPAATGVEGDAGRSGWQSTSPAVPSALTALADRASLQLNQLPRGV